MTHLPTWHVKRLRKLARGPCIYGRWDTVNAYLCARGLIFRVDQDVGIDRQKYAITEAGLLALAQARASAGEKASTPIGSLARTA